MVSKPFGNDQQFGGGVREAIHAGDNHHITLAGFPEQFLELGTIPGGTGDFLLEHLLAAGGTHAEALHLQGLVFGGDAGIAEFDAVAPRRL